MLKANVCTLLDGSCAKSDSADSGSIIYAKSGYYEDPNKLTARCTHQQQYQENPKVVSFCLTLHHDTTSGETECNNRGNCYREDTM
jgi:hypothetical protein